MLAALETTKFMQKYVQWLKFKAYWDFKQFLFNFEHSRILLSKTTDSSAKDGTCGLKDFLKVGHTIQENGGYW